jgi:hypothetical protein
VTTEERRGALEPRAFCVGQAKSGTASLYGLLAARYAAAHEPERAQLLSMILRESRGEVDRTGFASFLRSRQERLALDFDIAWANQFVIAHLLNVFPSARFVVLFRDPHSWLSSVIGHLLSRQIPPDVRAFLDWWFRPEEHPHSEEEASLRDRGIYSTGALLSAWRRHVQNCTERIPVERRLILRTHELGSSHEVLADFLRIPLGSLDAGRGHLNRRTWTDSIDSLLDRKYLHEQIISECGKEIETYFPEFRSPPRRQGGASIA